MILSLLLEQIAAWAAHLGPKCCSPTCEGIFSKRSREPVTHSAWSHKGSQKAELDDGQRTADSVTYLSLPMPLLANPGQPLGDLHLTEARSPFHQVGALS
jgi:hypothetical protein